MIKKIKQILKERKRKRFFKRYHFGKYSYCGFPITISDKASSVGNFSSIGKNVSIGLTQHPTNWLSSHIFQYIPDKNLSGVELQEWQSSKPVHIGNDVWIGSYAIIMDGVKVNDGAIIAAGAVVTKDVPPYAIVGGVPAKIIRYRFDEKTIQRLLKTQWWAKDINEIKKLPFNDIEKCLEILEKTKK